MLRIKQEMNYSFLVSKCLYHECLANEIYHVIQKLNGTNLQMLQYATLLRSSIVTTEMYVFLLIYSRIMYE
jgi:hypothetical protein